MPQTAHILPVALVAAATLCAQAALAGPPTPEALYAQGVERQGGGDSAGACAAFEASAQLREEPDALAAAAHCREDAGDLTAAEAMFGRAAELVRRADGDPQPHLQEAGRIRKANAVLVLDLTAVDVSAWVALSVDATPLIRRGGAVRVRAVVPPGAHQVSASRPGCDHWRTSIDAKPGSVVELRVPPLEIATKDVEAPARRTHLSGYAVDDAAQIRHRRHQDISKSARYERMGNVMFGVAIGTGLTSIWTWSESSSRISDARIVNCNSPTCSDEEGRALWESAGRYERVAWITGGIAATSLAAGFLLYWRADKTRDDDDDSVAAIPTAGGVVVTYGGAF